MGLKDRATGTNETQGADEHYRMAAIIPDAQGVSVSRWARVTGPVGLAVAWIAAIGALALWLSTTPEHELRDQLRRLQFWSLEAQLAVLAALTLIGLPALVRSLGLERRDYLAPLSASALALLLMLVVAPRTNRIYFDEHIYQNIGQNLADQRLAQMCNDGTVEYGSLQCWRGEYNKEPYAFPHLLSVVYRVIGAGDRSAHIVNAVVSSLTVWVVFFLATAVTDRPTAGRFAALVAALIPETLRWSSTAAAEPLAAFAYALAVLTVLAFVRARTTIALLWMMSAIVFAAQVRAEGLLIAGAAAVILMLRAPLEILSRRFWWAALAALGFAAVHLGHLVAVRNEGWGTTGPRFSFDYLMSNLATNGGFFLGDPRFPVFYTLLALAALAGFRERRRLVPLVLHFAAFWVVFLFFYAGSYNYGADDRFSLLPSPALAALAGIGAAVIAQRVADRGWLSQRRAATAVAAILVLQFTWYLPFVRATTEEAWGARADVSFARAIAHQLPPNSYVLTHNPGMFHLWGVNAGQLSLATSEPQYVADVLATRYAGGVFVHWNFWCNVADPVQQKFCAEILRQYPTTLVHEHRERNYRFAFYRMSIPGSPPDQK